LKNNIFASFIEVLQNGIVQTKVFSPKIKKKSNFSPKCQYIGKSTVNVTELGDIKMNRNFCVHPFQKNDLKSVMKDAVDCRY
jgi:hypothetical protein